MRFNIFIMLLCLLSGCGIKGDLVRPADIPEYRERQEQRGGSLPL